MASIGQGERGIRFTFETDPKIEKLGFELGRFAKNINDWTGLLKMYSPLFQRHMVEAFETEGAATGSRWPAVDPDYAARKKASGHGSKIGVYFGNLRSSMAGGGGYSAEIHGKTGSYGMTSSSEALPYGERFAEKRPVLRMSQRQVGEYLALSRDWARQQARDAGWGNASMGALIPLGGGVATKSVLAGA